MRATYETPVLNVLQKSRQTGTFFQQVLRVEFETAEGHGVTIKDLLGKSRDHTISRARAEAWHRLRNELGLTNMEIAKRYARHNSDVSRIVSDYASLLVTRAKIKPYAGPLIPLKK